MAQSTVLIVEDESIVAKDLEMTLSKLGYTVVGVVDTAEKAVSAALSKKPDVILMDIVLKGKDNGVAAAEKIKEELDVPVIYLTANADEATVEMAKFTEPHGYIIKPFKEVELQTAIELAIYKFEQEVKVKEERDALFSLVDNQDKRGSFMVKNKSRFIRLDPEQIIFVEALKDYVVINTPDNRYTIHSTMKEIEKKLPKEIYLRVHRSYIVQIRAIESIEYANITLKGVTKQIPVGGSYKDDLQTAMRYF
tara:strand:+ start:89969 stop:90721 length:753 start_codon:yes stop_codon:yes gene_type:complete